MSHVGICGEGMYLVEETSAEVVRCDVIGIFKEQQGDQLGDSEPNIEY